MKQENPAYPLPPAGRVYHRSDEEFAALKHGGRQQQHQARRSKCFVYVLAGIVILSIAMLIFASLVLRVKTPDVKLISVTVKNLRYGTAPSPSFNATLVAEVTTRNKNFGSFEFENGKTSVLYEGVSIGSRFIGHGFVKAKETKTMTVTVEVNSNRLSDSQTLSSDINSGKLKLNSYGKFSGTLCSVKIIKKKMTAEMNCTMTLNLASGGTIEDILCN